MGDWDFFDDLLGLALLVGVTSAYVGGCGATVYYSGKAIVSGTRIITERIERCADSSGRKEPKNCPIQEKQFAVAPRREEFVERDSRYYSDRLRESCIRLPQTQTRRVQRTRYADFFR